MATKTHSIYPIANPEYQFKRTSPQSEKAYLIVVEEKGMAAIQSFGETHNPIKKVIDLYTEDGFTVRCVYTGGEILKLAKLTEDWNKKPIDEVMNELERKLLKHEGT